MCGFLQRPMFKWRAHFLKGITVSASLPSSFRRFARGARRFRISLTRPFAVHRPRLKRGAEHNFSSRLLDAALLYDWPGNLRELRNFVTRTIILRDQDSAVRELETKVAAASGA